MGFLPGIHVVPGGRVDPDDNHLDADADALHPGVRQGLATKRPAAFLHAALRETFEETGLLVGRAGPLPSHLPADHPLWTAYRAAGIAPDLGGFDYLCRAITPVGSKRRFNTRFFLGDGAQTAGELLSNGELEDLAWQRVSALSGLNIVDVTQYVLDTAIRRWRDRIPVGTEAAKLLNYRNNIMTLSRPRQVRPRVAAQ